MKRIFTLIGMHLSLMTTAQLYNPTTTLNITTNPATTNVGIGTSTPAFKLDVNGNLRTTSFVNVRDYLTVDNGGSYRVALNGQYDGYVTGRNASNQDKFLINSNGSSYFNGGNVGIGIDIPIGALHVNTTRPIIMKNNGGNGVYGSEIGFNAVLDTSTPANKFRKLGGSGQQGGAAIVVDYVGNMLFQMYGGVNEGESIINYAPQIAFLNSGYVGIGTTNPQAPLDVKGRQVNLGSIPVSIGYSSTEYPSIGYNVTYTTTGNSYNYLANDNASLLNFGVGGFSFKTAPSGAIGTTIPFSEVMTIKENGNVGIGTTTPGSFKLAVNGKIWSQEVNVAMTNPGPDYVFEKDYNLTPLAELETYITKNKHLPEVPSAKEMEADGLNLKEMNLLLLKKVEELTLHLIKQEKEIKKLNQKIYEKN